MTENSLLEAKYWTFSLAIEWNVCVVFVVRMYSGVKIGWSRFECIKDATEQCLELYPKNDFLDEMQYVHHDEEIPPPTSHNGTDNDDGQTYDGHTAEPRGHHRDEERYRGGSRGSYAKAANQTQRSRYTPRDRSSGRGYRGSARGNSRGRGRSHSRGPSRGRGYHNTESGYKRPRQTSLSPDESHESSFNNKRLFHDLRFEAYENRHLNSARQGGY